MEEYTLTEEEMGAVAFIMTQANLSPQAINALSPDQWAGYKSVFDLAVAYLNTHKPVKKDG